MKKIIFNILFIILFLLPSIAFSNNQYNTESNVKKAILVEDYIVKHKEKIKWFIIKYNLSSNNNLNNDLKKLNEAIEALQKIQNTNIEKSIAESVLKSVLVRIRNINYSLKEELKKGKIEHQRNIDKKQAIYSTLWVKIADKIDSINLKIASKIFKNKDVLSLRESNIKKNLIKLNNESKKLRYFSYYSFSSEQEIKKAFVKILQNIKNEVNVMKSTLK